MATGVTVTAPEVAELDDSEQSAPELLPDLPICDPDEDRLGFKAYAEALAELIDSPSVSTPLTMSINAPWGAGKTSLARLVERLLETWPKARGEPPHLVVWFNAWMYSSAPNLGTALAAVVGKTAAEHRPLWRRGVQWLPASMLSVEARQRRRLLVLLVAAVVALAVAYLPHKLQKMAGVSVSREESRWYGLGVFAGIPFAATIVGALFAAAKSAGSFVRDPSAQAATGSMGDVGHQFAELVRSATRGRRLLVIFIDDLDRCPPDRALQVCETASLLLAVPDVVTVLLGDLTALRNYAAEHLSGAGSAGGAAAIPSALDPYARSFLDKIVQLDFALPPSGRALSTVLDRPDTRQDSGGDAGRIAESRASGRHTATSAPRQPRQAQAPATQPAQNRRGRLKGALGSLYKSICGRPRQYLAFVAITGGVLIVVTVVLASVDPNLNNNNKSDWEEVVIGLWLVLTAAAWFLAGIGTFVNSVQKRRARRRTAKIDEKIDEKLRSTAPGSGGASVQEAKEVAQSLDEKSDDLFEQRWRRRRVERLVREGQLELRGYLPHVPRGVKRVANRHYLLSSVAWSREMLGGTPELTPAHLAKWALIQERWPLVASEIVRNPDRTAKLEAKAADLKEAARKSSTGIAAGSLGTGLDESQIPEFNDLVGLLSDVTPIGSVARRLVFALPASDGDSMPPGAPAGGRASPGSAGAPGDSPTTAAIVDHDASRGPSPALH